MKLVLHTTAGAYCFALALLAAQVGVDGRLGAFAAGLVLFGVNLLLVCAVAVKFFEALGETALELGPRKTSPWLVLGLLVKVALLGGGAFLCLAVWSLDARFFVFGLVAGLVLFAVPATLLRRHFSLPTRAKVR